MGARRGLSQLDLAHNTGVSPRHLSFVETGKSKPSPELVLARAVHLEVPLRERNALLLAAGYAPRYQESSIDDPSMRPVRDALRRLLDAHDPFPGMVLDRRHDIVMTNHRTLADDLGLAVSSSATIDGHDLSMFSTLTSFGSPRDITLDDTSIELFFPADDATADALRLLVNPTQATVRRPGTSAA